MAIQSKLPHVGTTIFTVMSKLAQECGAINLSQGFPDFPIDEELIALVEEAMRAGHNQYAPMPGLPVLRETIMARCKALLRLRSRNGDHGDRRWHTGHLHCRWCGGIPGAIIAIRL